MMTQFTYQMGTVLELTPTFQFPFDDIPAWETSDPTICRITSVMYDGSRARVELLASGMAKIVAKTSEPFQCVECFISVLWDARYEGGSISAQVAG
jgi:hypothetical protein